MGVPINTLTFTPASAQLGLSGVQGTDNCFLNQNKDRMESDLTISGYRNKKLYSKS